MKVIRATQAMLDQFDAYAIDNVDMFPYSSCTQYLGQHTVGTDDWSDLLFVTEDCQNAISYDIKRAKENEIEVALYAKSPYLAGLLVRETLDRVIKMYNPKALTSVCHASNKKSIAFNTKRLGKPWGIEPQGAWNLATGEWEDRLHFKKILR